MAQFLKDMGIFVIVTVFFFAPLTDFLAWRSSGEPLAWWMIPFFLVDCLVSLVILFALCHCLISSKTEKNSKQNHFKQKHSEETRS